MQKAKAECKMINSNIYNHKICHTPGMKIKPDETKVEWKNQPPIFMFPTQTLPYLHHIDNQD